MIDEQHTAAKLQETQVEIQFWAKRSGGPLVNKWNYLFALANMLLLYNAQIYSPRFLS